MKQLKPTEELSKKIIAQLHDIMQDKDPVSYRKKVAEIFGLTEITPSEKSLIYLGGFINGEGSVNVSVKISNGSKFGIAIDPEFRITQHANGASMLLYALCYFHTGRIAYKSGSTATLVYRINNRISINEKVKPFFMKYMNDYCPESLRQRYNTFFRLLACFEQGDHLSIDLFEQKILPLWEILQVQSTVKTPFTTTAEVMVYIREFVRGKKVNKKVNLNE